MKKPESPIPETPELRAWAFFLAAYHLQYMGTVRDLATRRAIFESFSELGYRELAKAEREKRKSERASRQDVLDVHDERLRVPRVQEVLGEGFGSSTGPHEDRDLGDESD